MNGSSEEMKMASELVEIARAIHGWQTARGKSNAQMIRDFPGLGSDKTYTRLRDGRTEEYDVEAQLASYRGVWACIQDLTGRPATEAFYDDLSTVMHLKRAALEVMRPDAPARVVVYLAPSGGGKSVAARILAGRYGAGRIVSVEATQVWGDSPAALLGTILHALGAGNYSISPVARLEKCVEMLSQTRRMVIIDEAHHLGPRCINTLKTLVNLTPGEFLLLAIPTLWAKLETQAYQEARQLTTNRLAERLSIELTDNDVAKYLRHIFPKTPDEVIRSAARVIRPAAVGHGNMAVVRDVAAEAVRQAGDAEPDIKLFADAVTVVMRRRG